MVRGAQDQGGPATAADRDLAERLVDAVVSDFPDHRPGTRPVHTVGIAATGYFQPSDVAPTYSRAEQFRGDRVPVTVRFSNGSGSPVEHDNVLDARGMATRFHLSGGRAADLVMMTLPAFFVNTPDEFLDFADAGRPRIAPPESWWRTILDKLELRTPAPTADPGSTTTGAGGALDYADRHSFARGAVVDMSVLVTPTSYARIKYHAVHTFRATDLHGAVRFVRLAWEPVAGVRPVADPSALGPTYLHTELRERLAREPARFVLRMSVAGQGDDLDDPTVVWDNTQDRIVMGELVLTEVAADQEADCERISFNPTRVVPGLECSDDPILAARRDAYEVSRRRRGGLACPFSDGDR